MNKAIIVKTIKKGDFDSNYLDLEIDKLIFSSMVVFDTLSFYLDNNDKIVIKNEKKLLEDIKAEQINFLVFNIKLTPRQKRNLSKKYDLCILDLFDVYCYALASNVSDEILQIQIKLETAKNLLNSKYERLLGKDFMNTYTESKRIFSLFYDDFQTKRLSKFYRKSDIPIVSIIGHCNTGKTTLFNNLVSKYGHKKDLSKDTLTIDFKDAIINLGGNKKVRLIDSIPIFDGFPLELENIFEDLYFNYFNSDFYIIVEDFNFLSEANEMMEELFSDIIARKCFVFALNKVDSLHEYSLFSNIDNSFPMPILISAKEGLNINVITNAVEKNLFKDWKKYKIFLPNSLIEKHYHYFKIKTKIISEKTNSTGLMMEVEMPPKIANKFKDYIWLDNN